MESTISRKCLVQGARFAAARWIYIEFNFPVSVRESVQSKVSTREIRKRSKDWKMTCLSVAVADSSALYRSKERFLRCLHIVASDAAQRNVVVARRSRSDCLSFLPYLHGGAIMDVETRYFTADNWCPDDFNEHQRLAKANNRVTIVRYRVDAVVSRSYTPSCAGTITKGSGTISGVPTQKSLNSLCFVLNNSDKRFETMITATMARSVHRNNSVDLHKRALRAMLERLRREKESSQYCWVREHQENGSVHWHVFTDAATQAEGMIDYERTKEWSKWLARFYRKSGRVSDQDYYHMANGDGTGDFLGCTRYERLQTDAPGRYAGKEGAKRFQKIAPKKWRKSGCAWWRCSSNVVCTPIETVLVSPKHLSGVMITNDEGGEFEVLFKVQRNKGLVDDRLAVEHSELDYRPGMFKE